MAEAVGLALAVVPLIALAAEYYDESVDSLTGLRSKVGDDRILEFYEEIAFELYMLRSCLKKLVKDLPGLSDNYKKELIKSVRPETWTHKTLSDALQKKLGEINFALFEMSLRRLLVSLDALVSGNQQLLSSSEMIDENVFCVRLSTFRKDVVAGHTLSTLRKRIQFTTSKRKRAKHIEKITKYNERLQRILDDASEEEVTGPALQNKSLSPNMRSMAHAVHSALSRSWVCSCRTSHERQLSEARLCLRQESAFKDSFGLSFSILFYSAAEKDPSYECLTSWQESVIHTMPKTKNTSLMTTNTEITSICEVVEVARSHNICLRMLLDDEKLWRIRPQNKRLDQARNIPLSAIIDDSAMMRLKDKRVLAVALARTVLHLSEGPWLRRRWTPDQISFVETTEKTLDFERPYLSTRFDKVATDDTDSLYDSQSIHAIPSLLSLGKLLLEIDRGKLIEPGPLDLTEGKFPNANTELTATMRFFKESSGDFYFDYKRAVKACLEPTFLTVDQTGGLENAEVRCLVYEHVVVPLENELYSGFKIRLPGL